MKTLTLGELRRDGSAGKVLALQALGFDLHPRTHGNAAGLRLRSLVVVGTGDLRSKVVGCTCLHQWALHLNERPYLNE